MKGQVAEYMLVFAAVAAVAVMVLALSFQEFPFAVFDAQTVIVAVGEGYAYELNSFRDGGISTYSTEYNAGRHEVSVHMQVVGWPLSDIRTAVANVFNKYGYSVKWT